MITVYDSHETDFTHNGLCILDPIVKSCKITEVLNGEYSVDIELFKDDREKYKFLSEFSIIKVKGQLFRLYNPSHIQDTNLTIRGILYHISHDVNTDFLDYIELEDSSLDNVLQSVVLDNRFEILTSDISSTKSMIIENDKPLNCIMKTIIPAYNGELKRDNFKIGVVNRIGSDTDIVIEYAKNILGFEQSLDYTEIVTRLMPIGKDDATIELVNGGSKWINSPRVNDYFKQFSSRLSFNDIDDATELKTAAESLWGIIDLPKANYKVSFVELKDVLEYQQLYSNRDYLQLGDSITIRHKPFGINLTARVIKITRDGYTGRTLEIELGEFRETLFDSLDKLNYSLASVNTNLKQTTKDLYTKITENDEHITLEAGRLDGDIAAARAAIDVNATNIDLKVSKGDVIGEINVSPELIKIGAGKLELSAYATFYSLTTPGSSVIDGGNIKTQSINFYDLYNRPAIPVQYTDDMALTAIKNTYINSEGVWTTKVFAENIQAGTLRSVNLESSNLKMTGGNITFEPIQKYFTSGSSVPLTFNTYSNFSIEHTGELKFWQNIFWFDKKVYATELQTPGEVSCGSLKVNGTIITGNSVVAKFG